MDSSVGEPFGSIIREQFEAIRDGDRFWYENAENKLLSTEELAEIKATSLADVIQRNTEITGLRKNIFILNIKGTDSDDILEGTHLADQFCASLGNDLIRGGAGQDNVDYTSIDGPITLRFDGVLKGSNVIDELGLSAWGGLQDLANQGNRVAQKIFSLHTNFFGRSTSGFFDDAEHLEAETIANGDQIDTSNNDFDQLENIESVEANQGAP